MDNHETNSDDDGLNLKGPVRLRRNHSTNPLAAVAGSQNSVTSGSLTFDNTPRSQGPVARAPSFGAVSQPKFSPSGLFQPNIKRALASVQKKSPGDGVKSQPTTSGDEPMEDIGDLLTNSLNRSNMMSLRNTPGMFSTGGAMDAMNIRGAPRKQGAGVEMNVRAFHEHTRLMERRRQQLNSSKDEKSSISLTDLAFVDDAAAYPPIVVPYLMTESEVDGEEDTSGNEGEQRKFTTKFVDENNRKAGELLFSQLLNDASNAQPEWFLMQFPWKLPEGPGGTQNVADLPSGKIGELVIRESGAVELVLEKHDDDPECPIMLDVNVGAESAFHQQVVSYDTKNNEFVTLGDLTKRMVLTPQMKEASLSS